VSSILSPFCPTRRAIHTETDSNEEVTSSNTTNQVISSSTAQQRALMMARWAGQLTYGRYFATVCTMSSMTLANPEFIDE
jgi:hypothetical protein